MPSFPIGGALYGFQRGMDDQDTITRSRQDSDFNRQQAITRADRESQLFPLQRQAAQNQVDLTAANVEENTALAPLRRRTAANTADLSDETLRSYKNEATRKEALAKIETGYQQAVRSGDFNQLANWMTTLSPAGVQTTSTVGKNAAGADMVSFNTEGQAPVTFETGVPYNGIVQLPAAMPAGQKALAFAGVLAHPDNVSKILEHSITAEAERVKFEREQQGRIDLEKEKAKGAIGRVQAITARGEPARDLARSRQLKSAIDTQLKDAGSGWVSITEPKYKDILGFIYQRAEATQGQPLTVAGETVMKTKAEFNSGLSRLTKAANGNEAAAIANEYVTMGWPREAVMVMMRQAEEQMKFAPKKP